MAMIKLDFYMNSKLELEKIDVLHYLIVVMVIELFSLLHAF
jgi:hypothetical protein